MQNTIDRAMSLVSRHNIQIDQRTLVMDLWHAGVDIEAMADMPAADFNHDVLGIIANMNRQTCQLENCFSPRATRQL